MLSRPHLPDLDSLSAGLTCIAFCIYQKTQRRSMSYIIIFLGGGGGGGRRQLLGILASLLRLECKQKTFSNAFQIRIYFLFRSYSFGIETINTFIRFRSSLERDNQFQTKMGKVYTRFQTKKVQKPYPLGWHIPIWLL